MMNRTYACGSLAAIRIQLHLFVRRTGTPYSPDEAAVPMMGERPGLRPASGAVPILAGIALTELVPQPHVPPAHEA